MNLHLPIAIVLMFFVSNSIAETAKKVTHKHDTRSHTHVLPKASGLAHKHNAAKAIPEPVVEGVAPKSSVIMKSDSHYHGTRIHSHALPRTSYYHKHGNSQYGSRLRANAVKQPAEVAQTQMTDSTIPATARFKCSEISRDLAKIFLVSGHTYLDRDNDGDPCEPHNFPEQKPYVAPNVGGSSSSNCHWVSGYRRKSGSYVRGHTRCR